MTLTQEQMDAVERVVSSVDRQLKKWRAWFPNEKSEVEVPRDELLALVECGRIALANRKQPGCAGEEGA